MLKLIKQIDKVESYSCFHDNLLYFSLNNLYLNNLKFAIDSQIVIGGYLDHFGILCVLTPDKSYFFSINNDLIEPIFDTDHLRGFLGMEIDNNIQLTRLDNFRYAAYDILNMNIVEEYEAKFDSNYPGAYKKEHLFFHKFPDTIIQSLSLKTGEYTWETNLAKELTIADESQFRIVQLVGILGNNLWVTYSIDRLDGLLALDCATGHVSWKSAPDLGVDAVNVKRLEEKQVLFGLFGVYDRSNPVSPYFEVNGLTGDVRRKGFIESLFKERLIVKDWIYYANKIYFTARREMLTSNYIGVLDYDTLELLWYGEVPGRKGDLKELQVSENRLYVLDAAGTLHIFEETDEENQELVQEEAVKQLPQLANYKALVYDVDISGIEFFQKHPVDSYCVELSGNYATVLLSVLAAIESLTGERIEILEYDSEEEGATHIKYRILEEVLILDSSFMEFDLSNKLLNPVNQVLSNRGSVKKLKEFEPIPPDEYLILTYVTEEMYHQYGRAGYGIYEEYSRRDGKPEWVGVW